VRSRYTLRAFADREAIFDYLEKRSPKGAQTVKQAIENSIRRLEDFPYSASATDEPGIHELIVPRCPYKVYYRVVDDEVWMSTSVTHRAGHGLAKASSRRFERALMDERVDATGESKKPERYHAHGVENERLRSDVLSWIEDRFGWILRIIVD
jgi:toxin ParE1/3/4